MSLNHYCSTGGALYGGKLDLVAKDLIVDTLTVTDLLVDNLFVEKLSLFQGTGTFYNNLNVNLNLGVTGTSNLAGGVKLGVSGSPTGYVPSLLTTYQYTGFTGTVSGPWAATAATFTVSKLGNIVSLQSAAIAITEVSSSIIGFNPVLPAYLWPNIGVSLPIVIVNNGTQETGYFAVDASTGGMTITRNIGAFTGAGTAGYRSFCVSYQTAT